MRLGALREPWVPASGLSHAPRREIDGSFDRALWAAQDGPVSPNERGSPGHRCLRENGHVDRRIEPIDGGCDDPIIAGDLSLLEATPCLKTRHIDDLNLPAG